jgi:DNA-binding CsgD family transcriptional regulator
MAAEALPLHEMLRRDLSRVKDDDVRLFFDYFEELKLQVGKYLRGKARIFPGDSAVAESALFSLFCNATLAGLSLAEVDEEGYPALWPLLLLYIERHCNKWNKYYRAKKRQAIEVPLIADRAIDPPDYRAPNDDEAAVGAALEALYVRLTPRQRCVADLTVAGKTLEQIAQDLGCSESLVSLEKKAIRRLLENA